MVTTRTSVACLFAVVLTIIEFFPGVPCYHMNLCVGIPYGDTNGGMSSIGSQNDEYQKDYQSKSAYTDVGCFIIESETWIKWTPLYIEYNSTDISIDTNEENVLLGWLHFDMSFLSDFHVMVIQPFVPAHHSNYVPGEFVSTRFKPGLKERVNVWEMSKAHLSPCYFVSDPSPIQSVAFVLKDLGGVASMKLNFRMDFPECAMVHENRHLEYRFYANRRSNAVKCRYGEGSTVISGNQNKIFVKNSTYGSYDPEPPRHAQISIKVLRPNMSNYLWVTDYSQSYLVNYQPAFINSECHNLANLPRIGRFAGRCTLSIHNNWLIGPSQRLRCRGENANRVGPGYVIYVPENTPGAGTCVGCAATRNNTRRNGISANSEIGRIIWGFRTTHGISMVMTTMFVVPLGTLVSRYYKETLMGTRFVNVHVWHGIHISTALTAFAGLFSGWLAAFTGRSFFGFSRHSMGYAHWILGYISFLAFLLALFPGPIRAFAKGMRKMTIFLHFLVATVARVLWLLCLLTSFYIPGSPSGRNDIHVSGFTFELYIFIVVTWFIVDVVINVILMVFLKGTDKEKKKSRTYAMTVPIPLIRPYVEEDLPGARMRKILFVVHTSICFVCAFVLTTLICWSSPEDRWFGPMWYTHKDSGKLNMLMKDTFYD